MGFFGPLPCPSDELTAGDVGYIATGLKSVVECRVGDTVTTLHGNVTEPLIGYHPPKPMVFAGIYTTQAEDYKDLRADVNFRRVYEYTGGSWQASGWRPQGCRSRSAPVMPRRSTTATSSATGSARRSPPASGSGWAWW